MREREYLFEAMKKAALSYAYEPFDGPMLEEVSLYKAKSGEELINEQIYDFVDRGKRHVAIRPEMTPTVARMVAQIHKQTPKPIRWYSIPNLMRYEKPQRGRLREHWQFNVDVFGAPNGLGEIEVLSVLSHLLESLGATEDMFGILLNDRQIVDFVFKKVIKADDETAHKLYKIIDKSKKVDLAALEKMTSEVLSGQAYEAFFKYLSLKSFNDVYEYLQSFGFEKTEDLKQFVTRLENSHAGKYVQYDPAIVRGLDYYTGVVFEVFDKHPDNRRAIAGGGAYANLLQIFNESPLPGVGFGMGDVTLKDFLVTHGLMPDFNKPEHDVFVAYMDEQSEAFAMKASSVLRSLGLTVDTNLGPLKPKKAFKTAEAKGAKFVTVIGADEAQEKKLGLKNQKTREEKTFSISETTQIKDFTN